MPTINQLIRHGRVRPINKTKVPAMQSCPQKRGVCTRVYTRARAHACTHACTRVKTHAYTHVCTRVYLCTRVNTYVYVRVEKHV